jgi:transposase
MRVLYAGCDLHGNSNLIGIIDAEGKRVFKKKLSNDLALVRDTLEPFQRELVGIAVESTYNWYWLVDGLMENGYQVHLANPSAIQQYSGLKHSDDQHDAFWLAEMLRLGILPEGYIYPKQERPVRDLLRKRGHLVRLLTSLIISLQNVSYCRKVPSQWTSNEKRKGSGNKKNGNKYLAWAYSEASAFARQLYPEPRAYYNRKMQKTNAAVAHSALANKLSRAGYYVMRDQVPFEPKKLFG